MPGFEAGQEWTYDLTIDDDGHVAAFTLAVRVALVSTDVDGTTVTLAMNRTSKDGSRPPSPYQATLLVRDGSHVLQPFDTHLFNPWVAGSCHRWEFPLESGAQWTSSCPDGAGDVQEYATAVGSPGDVQVPAGLFDALPIEVTGDPDSMSGRTVAQHWFAPEGCGLPVRSLQFPDPIVEVRMELVEAADC